MDVDPSAEDFDAAAALEEIKSFTTTEASGTVEVEDEETLAVDDMTVYYSEIPANADKESTVPMTYLEAVDYFENTNPDFAEPDPADYGVWVPGVPVLVGNALEAAGAADWLSGLINDGIVAGVGAVLGFWGTKPSTAPTPATIPSLIRLAEPIRRTGRFQRIADENRHAGHPHAVICGIGLRKVGVGVLEVIHSLKVGHGNSGFFVRIRGNLRVVNRHVVDGQGFFIFHFNRAGSFRSW